MSDEGTPQAHQADEDTDTKVFELAVLEALPLAGFKLADIERVAIEQTLQHTRGSKSRAAALLGIAPSTLYEKLKRFT